MKSVMNVFDGFEDVNDVCAQFSIDAKTLKGYRVVVAVYNSEGYEGDAFVLLKKGHEYFEANGSHCSCYGLEGQFDLENVPREALKKRFEDGRYLYGAQLQAQATIKEHFGWS